MKTILATALAIGLLTSTAFAEDKTKMNWPNEQETKEGVKIFERSRTAFAGKPLELDSLLMIDFDCNLRDADRMVTQEPEHGEVAIKTNRRQTAYIGAYEKCNRVWPVPTVVYTPAVGFTGTDTFEVSMVGWTGFTSLYRYTIKVINPKKN